MGSYLVKNPGGFFDERNAFHPAGSLVEVSDDLVKEGDTHLEKFDGSTALPRVQVAPITVTGPNPTAPQQIPPDARQTISGYEQPGVQLVGEVTKPEEQRIADQLLDEGAESTTQGEVTDQLAGVTEENGGDSGGETDEADDLDGQTKAELLETAKAEGVDATSADNKAEIAEKIRAARQLA